MNSFFNRTLIVFFIALLLTSCNREVKESYWENGNLKSKLTYKNDRLHGPAIWYFENGNKEHEVHYTDNKLNGTQKRWYKNGRLESESTYAEGKSQGLSIIYDQLGNKVIEEYYVNDTLDGSYFKFYTDKSVQIEGAYNKGFFTGRWVYYDLYGNVVGIGNFENGTGVQKGWWPNGSLKREIYYYKNLKHGEEKWYNENGKLEKINIYENGVLLN